MRNARFIEFQVGGGEIPKSKPANSVTIELQGKPSVTITNIGANGFWSHTYSNLLPGTKQIVVKARHFSHTSKTPFKGTIEVGDMTPPILSVVPPPSEVLVEGKANFNIIGDVRDEFSNVASVKWTLERGELDGVTPGETKNAILAGGGKQTSWTIQATMSSAGTADLRIFAEDASGNVTTGNGVRSVQLIAFETFEPQDPNDPFGRAGYLSDLLRFAETRFFDSESGSDLTAEILQATFHQPFKELAQRRDPATANALISKARIGIEVLHRLLAGQGQLYVSISPLTSEVRDLLNQGSVPQIVKDACSTLGVELSDESESETLTEGSFWEIVDGVRRFTAKANIETLTIFNSEKLAQDVDAHVQESYAASLRNLSTSEAELRATRGDDDAVGLLASRLGVDPERLHRLLLATEEITERQLESIFGLPKIFDVSPSSENQLSVWRTEFLHGQWLELDSLEMVFGDVAAPMIDPDLLTGEDFERPTEGDDAFDLFTQRQEEVAAVIKAIEAKRKESQDRNSLSAFDAVVGEFIAPIDNDASGDSERLSLTELRERHESGRGISVELAALRLPLDAFLRLMGIREAALSEATPDSTVQVSDPDWDDLIAIATQVSKVRATREHLSKAR